MNYELKKLFAAAFGGALASMLGYVSIGFIASQFSINGVGDVSVIVSAMVGLMLGVMTTVICWQSKSVTSYVMAGSAVAFFSILVGAGLPWAAGIVTFKAAVGSLVLGSAVAFGSWFIQDITGTL